jgi:hypothetical protein
MEGGTMSIIIRVVIVAFCAYAGSVVADNQFSELPSPGQLGQNQ